MLTITVEFLAGVYHADPDGGANLGRAARGEWPPSPARLLAAFIAADGTRCETTATNGDEVELLASAPPPLIVADPNPEHSPIVERFVVGQDTAGKTTQEYPARSAALKRSGVQVAPRLSTVSFVYSIDMPADLLGSLRYRAARIGYLGCSDSPTRVTVSDRSPPPDDAAAVFSPDPDGSWDVNTHTRQDVARWIALHDEAQRYHTQRSYHRGLKHVTRYRASTDPPDAAPVERPMTCWLRFSRPLPARRVVWISRALKAAVLAGYSRLHRPPVPDILHGHRQGKGYELVRFLPLPNVGHPHSDGRVHGAVVWIPPSAGEQDARRILRAAMSVRELRSRRGAASIEVWESGRPGRRWPWAANPARWETHRPERDPSEQWWATAFPVVLEKHGPVTLSTLNAMAAHAGLPDIAGYWQSRLPFISGGVSLDPSETTRPGKETFRPYFHFLLRFAEPVTGPVALGAGRARGLGLLAPVGPDHLPTVGTVSR